MVVTVNKWSKKVRKCKIRTRTITTFVLVDCFVPVDFRIHRVNNCGSATRADSISASSYLGDYKSPRTKGIK